MQLEMKLTTLQMCQVDNVHAQIHEQGCVSFPFQQIGEENWNCSLLNDFGVVAVVVFPSNVRVSSQDI